MIRAFLVIWIVVGGFLVCPFVWAQSDLGLLKKGVVKVSAQFDKSGKVGTGFIAGQGQKYVYIVTASHVVEQEMEVPESILVTFFTGQEEPLPARVVKKEGGDPRGLALLKVGGAIPEDIQILEWDNQSQLHGGEEVMLIGFPRVGGNAWAVTKGTLSGFDGPVLKFSGAVEEGNSGGPLLYQGKVIGVVMEVTGQFGNAKPSQIAQFTVENWPGFTRTVRHPPSAPTPESSSSEKSQGVGASNSKLASLVISTMPDDAQVFVDDELVGHTTEGSVVVDHLVPDAYDLMVKKPGFRPWTKSVELLSGERQEVKAILKKGSALTVTGIWKNPSEPTLSYVLQQTGEQVVMKEVTTSILGTMITAEGEGQVQGNQLEIFYRTAIGTMGHSTAIMSEDGQHLTGTFQDFSNMIPVALSLVRTADVPASVALPGNDAWQKIQELGR
ncbi:MAG: serine protease [Nitrospirales bacterium]